MDCTWHYESPLGGITLASDGEALVGLWFDGQKYFADSLDRNHEEKLIPALEEACRWLDIYFSGQVPDFTPRLNIRATPFRTQVYETLLTIPYGQTMTYGEIASSARAVGGAVGHNPISLIVPCHRVVGKDGSLTGYAGGMDRKKWLLDMEAKYSYSRNSR